MLDFFVVFFWQKRFSEGISTNVTGLALVTHTLTHTHTGMPAFHIYTDRLARCDSDSERPWSMHRSS